MDADAGQAWGDRRWTSWSAEGAQSLSHSAYGRVYDPAGSNPDWYYTPSVAVNSAGDLLLGFSGSKATEYIGALWVGRKANGQTTRPYLIQAGRAYHALLPSTPPDTVRRGDYSFTGADPDGTSFWTAQEYGEVDTSRPVEPNNPVANAWDTWFSSVRP